MAFDLSLLAAKTIPLPIQFEGETIQAHYKPHKMTPKFWAFLVGIDKNVGLGETQKHSGAEMASTMLDSWDVVFNGEPYPPTYENLIGIPTEMLSAVVEAIWTGLGKRMSSESDG